MNTKHQLTAEEARSFAGFSETNASLLMQAAQQHGCNCLPYADWFTYDRWLAQGMQVQRGEHGEKLTTFIKKTVEKEGQEKAVSYPRTVAVFCRCQVKPCEDHFCTEKI